MIKRQSIFMIALVIMAMACIGIATATPLDSGNNNVITVSSTGNVIGTPDRAQVTFAVQTENPDVKIAQQDNAQRMATVIDALVAIGIPRDALKTTGYNIYPVYDDYSKSLINQKIRTYQVTNTLTVTLHDVSRTGDVIDVAVANGINQASSIQFLLSDEHSQVLRTEALTKAVARARADADTVASALGTPIIGVQSADISGGYSPVLFENYQSIKMDATMGSATPTSIQPGDITVSAQVSITYLIR
jgi:hypothetical protein